VKPLWLDELIQLQGTAGTWDALLQHVLQNAGGAPLGYLGQHWLISVAGVSIWTARVLSVLAGAGSLALLFILAKNLGLKPRTAGIAASFWIVCPLLFRYSLEGRPYMQALFFALAASIAQVKLSKTCGAGWALALAGCQSAAVYSQPFAAFAPLGFSLCNVWQSRKPKCAALTFAAYAVAGLSFLPWLIAAQSHWRDAIAHSQGGFVWSASLVLLLLRECVGDGYPAAIPILLLAAYGAREIVRNPLRDPRAPLAAAFVSTLVLALLADAKFNYFFAIRQVIYMAPFLLLIAAEGAAALWESSRYRVLGAILVVVFVGASAAKDYRHFADRNEDWNRLSAALSEAALGGCILVPASDNLGMYTMFRPGIAQQLCGADTSARRIVVPVHAYTEQQARQAAEAKLSAMGMTRLSVEEAGFGRVEVFTRPDF
jgi:uncharacterized membrane protein